MRVPVVDGDLKAAKDVSRALKAEGFAVDSLHHGDEALGAILRTPFDADSSVLVPHRAFPADAGWLVWGCGLLR